MLRLIHAICPNNDCAWSNIGQRDIGALGDERIKQYAKNMLNGFGIKSAIFTAYGNGWTIYIISRHGVITTIGVWSTQHIKILHTDDISATNVNWYETILV